MVNHLLRNADGLRLAVLVNEFGDLAIDEDLIEAEGDDIISIAGGCVCCSFGSDLTAALMRMATLPEPPDHIVIEASGVAIPGAIVGTLSLLEGFRTDGIVIVADGETIERSARDKYMGDTVLRQISEADIIVLNKVDLLGQADLDRRKAWLADVSGNAGIVEAVRGQVAPATVLSSFLNRARSTTGGHSEATELEMLTLVPKEGADIRALAAHLAAPESGLIRAKGFAVDADGSRVIVQVVGARFEVHPTTLDVASGIVCLGFKGVVAEPDFRRSIQTYIEDALNSG